MIALLQRVRRAHVEIAGERVAGIERGLLVFTGMQRGDTEQEGDRLLQRVLGYRVFPDSAGRMNLDVREAAGGVLLVPQFTLAADTRKGMRPSFTPAATPDTGERLFEYLAGQLQTRHAPVACGRFGADMQVALINDGPVTFWLEVKPPA
ncbi:MAG: D-aminoacyl-tRNA deacylase [Gammaproteobacteria bacterium]